MKEIFEGLKSIVEFILLGGMITAVLAYGFIWIHPLKVALTEYFKDSYQFLVGSQVKPGEKEGDGQPTFSKPATISVLALLAGYLYFAGSLTNVVGYWVMKPAHNADLARFYAELSSECPTIKTLPHASSDHPEITDGPAWYQQQIRPYEWIVFKRLLWARESQSAEQNYNESKYHLSLKEEAEFRTYSPESADGQLVRFPSKPGHHSEANHATIPKQTRPRFRANRPPLFDGVV